MPIKFTGLTEQYFTTKEAAQKLRVSQDTVKRYCNQVPQKLRGTKVGSSWMIPASAIKEYISSAGDYGRPRNAG